MPYTEYQPNPDLSHCIDCFRSYTSNEMPSKKPNVIIPENCADILIDLSHSEKIFSSFIGTMTRPIQSSKTNLIGICFKPGYAYAFFGIPMSEFTNTDVKLNDFWAHTDWLEDEIKKRKNITHQIGFLQEMLFKFKRNLSPLKNIFISS